MLNRISQKIHQNAKDKGFFDGPKNIGEMLALIHSEVSEALEADRKGNTANLDLFLQEYEAQKQHGDEEAFKFAFKQHVKDSFEDELCDVIIRVFDLAAFKGIDIDQHLLLKMRYNSMREHKHGKKY